MVYLLFNKAAQTIYLAGALPILPLFPINTQTPGRYRGIKNMETGNSYAWLTPYSILLGSIFLLVADISTRLINPPSEIPLGVIIAFIGAPFFIYIAFKGGRTCG